LAGPYAAAGQANEQLARGKSLHPARRRPITAVERKRTPQSSALQSKHPADYAPRSAKVKSMPVRRRALFFATLAILAAARPCAAADPVPNAAFAIEEKADRLIITDAGKPVAEYVFTDPVVKRPYFRYVHTPSGIQVTRTHPPVEGKDLADHPTFHPGIWWGFGDINGEDFWRNKATIRHERMEHEIAQQPIGTAVQIRHECVLVTAAGQTIGKVGFASWIRRVPSGYQFDLQIRLGAVEKELVLGDQEEMGLGVRLATPLIEKNGGRVTSDGKAGAKTVWGTKAGWCDYSGAIDGRKVGVTISSFNGDHPWWHVRDYGLMVANDFGKRARPESPLTVVKDVWFKGYLVLIHDAPDYDPAKDESIQVKPGE
jgi:hypothetical protein